MTPLYMLPPAPLAQHKLPARALQGPRRFARQQQRLEKLAPIWASPGAAAGPLASVDRQGGSKRRMLRWRPKLRLKAVSEERCHSWGFQRQAAAAASTAAAGPQEREPAEWGAAAGHLAVRC